MSTAVFLTHTAAPSGAELATLRLVSALREQGRLDVAMVYTEDGPMVERMRERGIETRVVRGRFDSRAMTIGSGPLRLVAGFAALLRLGWTLGATARELGADVLVAESSKALVLGAVAARRARVPLVWQVHDRLAADYFGRLPTLVLHVLGRLFARGYLANSRTTLRTLRTGRRPARIAYPGVELGPDAPRPGQRPSADTVVAVVGRLSPWKGQDVLLRAVAATKVPPRQVFLIGGTFFDEEPYRAELERLARELALPVTFTGHVDDPAPYLRDADILVHSSVLPEPFGQVVVEGMHAGCAVIASTPGGPEEIIEPGVHGLLVTGGDERQLTAALDTLIGDPGLRTRLATAARLRANDFDITETARTVAAFLDDLAQRNEAAGAPPSPERAPHG
ncbi:glycosyltransferase involved in cell wall biosynthesis [Nocardia tenerifensis]|uniref:Glycosyltransferase involved in cell wall biosynthesis n=1 Tax=Nocardia tenerifensis TaxID=228006 RepID=A0A318JTD7_9NOCA|nr:glycosyltransferase family 4 protein [Nocardia tenerifensis]PXX58365.1 glycosyltransferase involved in cell wall biosynthesis [Nocardia tenerifensis]